MEDDEKKRKEAHEKELKKQKDITDKRLLEAKSQMPETYKRPTREELK